MESKPTFEQAQLHLQVYEMRRESRLRQARDWFFSHYSANTFDEAMRIAAPKDLKAALSSAFNRPGAKLIEVMVDGSV